jgi:alpha/beta hydrolase fold
MRDRPFPFSAGRSTIPPMLTEVQPEAALSLRATDDFVRSQVRWPVDARDDSPMAVVLAERDSELEVAHALCAEAGFVVLALRTAELDVATIAVEWAADHGPQLGADPERLLVAGGRLAAAAALHARDEGWPPLSRQLLIGPGLGGWPLRAASLAGLAPATVVNAPGYAARLRAAGVDVDELLLEEPLSFDWIRRLRHRP